MNIINGYITNKVFNNDNSHEHATIGYGNPTGIITPKNPGELYFDNSTNQLWIAIGTAATSWIKASESDSTDILPLFRGRLNAIGIDDNIYPTNNEIPFYTSPGSLYQRNILISVCNMNTEHAEVRIAHNNIYLFHTMEILNHETKFIDIDGLEPLDTITIWCNIPSVSFSIFGETYGLPIAGTRIGLVNLPLATLTSLVQSNQQTVYNTISVCVCNTSREDALLFRLAVIDGINIENIANKDYIIYDETILPSETRIFKNVCSLKTSSILAACSTTEHASIAVYGTRKSLDTG